MKSKPEIAPLLERAARHAHNQGQRWTQVRAVISACAFESEDAFHAEALLTRARQVDRAISMATVYRTLGHLVEAGLLRAIPGPDGHRHYAVADTPAAGMTHVVCRDCKQVIPLSDPCLSLRESGLARQIGFQPREVTLRVEADCEEFHKSGTCARHRGQGA